MGIQHHGMFGGFYKKAGGLIGKRGKGKDLVAALPHPSSKPATEKQLLQQRKFAMLTEFLNPLGKLVETGFKQYAKKNTPLNAACKFNWEHAFREEENGEVTLDYQAIIYSRGNIATANCPSLTTGALLNGRVIVTVSWLPQSQSLFNQATDFANCVIFNERTKKFKIATGEATRGDLSCVVDVADVSTGDTLYCYLNFFNNCSKLTGNSVCIGIIELTS